MVRWYLFYLSGYVQSSYGLNVYNLLLHTANLTGGKFSEVNCRLCCSKSWTTMKQSIFVTLMMLNACGFIDSSKIFSILKIFLRNRVGINQCLIWLLIYWSRQARDSRSCTSMLDCKRQDGLRLRELQIKSWKTRSAIILL